MGISREEEDTGTQVVQHLVNCTHYGVVREALLPACRGEFHGW